MVAWNERMRGWCVVCVVLGLPYAPSYTWWVLL